MLGRKLQGPFQFLFSKNILAFIRTKLTKNPVKIDLF